MAIQIRHLISWLLGLLGLIAVIVYFEPGDFLTQLHAVGIRGVAGWVLLTLVSRMLTSEVTVLAVNVLGFHLRRADAFWINWVRSFANQIIPLSGLAYFAYEVRRKAGIPWSGLTALSSPLIFLAATALGLFGLVAVAANFDRVGSAAIPMLAGFLALAGISILIVRFAEWLVTKVSARTSSYAADVAASLTMLSNNRALLGKLIALNALAIISRGGRLWLLFITVGVGMNWSDVLLLIVICESTMLVQITPGGMGLREGAIVGAGLILGIAPETSAAIALIDRLFVVGTTTLMVIPAHFYIRNSAQPRPA